ncbi:MAG: leucyl/phenylalanyl-tRNA--protein transferase [Methyloceanibacter sp.]|uniref:leucyl/phenylalanyl-tRNA--protein transferase n=1 Tax=Methyloceanibacter sp. TaxID=1965321 RepID=UPI003D6CAD57
MLSPFPDDALIGPELAPQDLQARRDALFRETVAETLQRIALGAVWSLQPKRLDRLPALARLSIAHLLDPDDALPDLIKMPGAGELVGIADDLSVATLAEAYAKGLFPHAHFGPTKWLSPPERCVLFFDDYHISKRVRRLMRQGAYTVTFDRDFEGVIKACAGKREGHWHLTWITPRIMRAYAALYDAGLVHSFEVWNADGALAGGGYGVAIGRVFFTESQFSRTDNTSKLGFSVLNWHLARWGYALNDGKWATPTILDMGFRMVPRERFLRLLAENVGEGGRPGRWTVEAGSEAIADWHPGSPGTDKAA